MVKKNTAKNAAIELAKIKSYEEGKKKKARVRNILTIVACSVAVVAIAGTVAITATNVAQPEGGNSGDAKTRVDAYTSNPPATDYTPTKVDADSYSDSLPTITYSDTATSISYPDGYTVPKDLVVKKLESGSGEEVDTTTDAVQMNYSGWNLAGAEFDSNIDAVGSTPHNGTPFDLPAGPSGVIDGWIQGLKGTFHIGDKLMLVIPNSMAYGASGKDITSDTSTAAEGPLVFYVEFVGKGSAAAN